MVDKFLLASFLERKTTHWMAAPATCEMFGCIADNAASRLTGEDSDQHMINQMQDTDSVGLIS
jgi:hypothetical protein